MRVSLLKLALCSFRPVLLTSAPSYRSFLHLLATRRMASNKKECIPCSTMDSSFLLNVEDVKKKLDESLSVWDVAVNESGHPSLTRKFVAKNFQAALDCINAMGVVAERESHHPDFHLTKYREVEVVIFTHKLSGITENDLTLAELFDKEVQIEYSPKWLRGHPEAQSTAKDSSS